MTTLVALAGIYVIEVSHGVIKVGMSADTDRRIATHLRHARGLGADPYRYAVIPCPASLLREAECDAHAAVRAAGGTAQARTPEVFTDAYFTPVYNIVAEAVRMVIEHDEAMTNLRSLEPHERDLILDQCPRDVATIVARLLK